MDLDNTLKNQATPVAAPVSKENSTDMEMTQFSEHGSFNLAMFLLWLCAIVAVLGSVFLWFLSRSAASELKDKQTAQAEVISKLNSPANLELETKAKSLVSAVTQLKTATADRYLMNEFMPLLYSRINKNVSLANLSIGGDGGVSMDGTTDSYKSAAEQLLSLREWKIDGKNVFSEAQLGTMSEDISSGVKVSFSISGKIDKTVKLTTTATTTGGQNAEVQ